VTPHLRLADFLPYRLSVASNAVSDRVAAAYQARFGLRIAEWRVIAVVAEQRSATQARLCQQTAMDKMTVSRAVATLVARGLLARAPGADRRTPVLSLTADGSALYGEIAPAALAIEADLLAGFSTAERTLLADMLERLRACAKP
jgi:DNA-binding MarR family transcriptional regulator